MTDLWHEIELDMSSRSGVRPRSIGAEGTNVRVNHTLDEREPVERERWLGERLHGDPDEEQRIVVAGRPVRGERAAAPAAVDEDPFAILADRDRDRLHRRLAVRRTVARVDVEVTRPEAVRAMVAMAGAGRHERDVEPAMDAAEGFGATVMAALTLGS